MWSQFRQPRSFVAQSASRIDYGPGVLQVIAQALLRLKTVKAQKPGPLGFKQLFFLIQPLCRIPFVREDIARLTLIDGVFKNRIRLPSKVTARSKRVVGSLIVIIFHGRDFLQFLC